MDEQDDNPWRAVPVNGFITREPIVVQALFA